MDVDKVMKTLDVNGDGFVELDEIAHVTGLKVGNPILVKKFHEADVNGEYRDTIIVWQLLQTTIPKCIVGSIVMEKCYASPPGTIPVARNAKYLTNYPYCMYFVAMWNFASMVS